MGMFDTIYFDKAYICPLCQGKIDSVQVKDFENLLEVFHVKDCISYAEDIRIMKKELFCHNCSKFTGKNVYLVISRGILLETAGTLEEAKNLLNDLNFEKLVLWYHDLYQRFISEQKEKHSYRKFLEDVKEWYSEKVYEKLEHDLTTIRFIYNSRHLKGARNAIESIERFLTYKEIREALDMLWKEGYETLDIYYPEDISTGEESWSVDVYQDEVNERCHLNWTWTVISRKELEKEGEKEDDSPEWEIVVDEPFSDEVVRNAIEKWLKDRRYEFGVRMISLEQARGSGMVKELRARDTED